MAWLACVPEGKETSRAREYAALNERHPALDMPEVEYMEHLLKYADELGYHDNRGFGPCPLSFVEIAAWQQATGTDLTPWEVSALRRLSREYVAQLAANDPGEPSPYFSDDLEARRDSVMEFFKSRSRQAKPQ